MATEINYLQDLDDVRDAMSGDYILMRDLDFTDDDSYDQTDVDWETKKAAWTSGGAGWTPINQTFTAPVFNGTLDGQGYSIKNLYVRQGTASLCGLFGYVVDHTIENLVLDDADVEGGAETGTLCGRNLRGMIENITLNSCKVTAKGSYVGGVIGNIYGETCCCYVHGVEVIGDSGANRDRLGGFAGNITGGDVYDCWVKDGDIDNQSAGNYTAGFVGLANGGTISTCNFCGDVDTLGSYVGGFVGYANTKIANCYTEGTVTHRGATTAATTYAGAFTSRHYRCSITKCYTRSNMVYPNLDPDRTNQGFAGTFATGAGYEDVDNFFSNNQLTTSGNATSKTDSEMKKIITFTDTATVGLTNAWDMVDREDHDGVKTTALWFIDEGVDYPRLWFEWTAPDDDTNFLLFF